MLRLQPRCRGLAALMLLAALAGCASAPPDGSAGTSPAAEAPVREPADYGPLEYYAWLSSAPPAAAEAELARLEGNWWWRNTLVDRVQHALVLSASTLAGDAGRRQALELLDGVAKAPAAGGRDAEYRQFAAIWRSVLVLRDNLTVASLALRRAREDLRETDASLQQVREAFKDALESREGHARQIQELETQIRSLKKQIEALTTIEQQLIEREQR